MLVFSFWLLKDRPVFIKHQGHNYNLYKHAVLNVYVHLISHILRTKHQGEMICFV